MQLQLLTNNWASLPIRSLYFSNLRSKSSSIHPLDSLFIILFLLGTIPGEGFQPE